MLGKTERQQALAILKATYPGAGPALRFTTPYELLVATMLSAQCTDKMVNRVTEVLFARANTPEQMCTLTEEELCGYIHSCGFYRMKGKHILETSQILVDRFGGEVPADRDVLTELPGVGRKTANVVVSNAFHIPAIAVDTHVFRVSNRIGLAEAATVDKTEKQLMENIPQEDWTDAHHWLIYHGRQVCASQRPKCAQCLLNGLCLHYNKKEKTEETL